MEFLMENPKVLKVEDYPRVCMATTKQRRAKALLFTCSALSLKKGGLIKRHKRAHQVIKGRKKVESAIPATTARLELSSEEEFPSLIKKSKAECDVDGEAAAMRGAPLHSTSGVAVPMDEGVLEGSVATELEMGDGESEMVAEEHRIKSIEAAPCVGTGGGTAGSKAEARENPPTAVTGTVPYVGADYLAGGGSAAGGGLNMREEVVVSGGNRGGAEGGRSGWENGGEGGAVRIGSGRVNRVDQSAHGVSGGGGSRVGPRQTVDSGADGSCISSGPRVKANMGRGNGEPKMGYASWAGTDSFGPQQLPNKHAGVRKQRAGQAPRAGPHMGMEGQ